MPIRALVIVAAVCLAAGAVVAVQADEPADPEFDLGEGLQFDDSPLRRDVEHPDWFKLSFLNLPADLEEARDAGKRGIMVYFGQAHCAYCKALMEVNFAREDIAAYTRKNFDVIPIDIWGDREVVDMAGNVLTEKAFAEREHTQFTPSIIFYDFEGEEAFRLHGYYPPYQFRAALEYMADGHYLRETFREYLARAEGVMRSPEEELNEEDFFEQPPYILDRSRFPAERPLAVFFEQGACHACDVLHIEQLGDPEIVGKLEQFQAVQLDMSADTPVLTPGGERLSARQWARALGLFYAPTILFFDEAGREIIRVDSVVRFYRLKAVLDYVLSKDYLRQPYFQRWREELQATTAPEAWPGPGPEAVSGGGS
jgi:thioredoxin-related protein